MKRVCPKNLKLNTPMFNLMCYSITKRYPNWMPQKLNPNAHLILHEQDSACDNYHEYAQFRDSEAYHNGQRRVRSWYVAEIEKNTLAKLKEIFPAAKNISRASSFERDLGVRFEDVLPELNSHLAQNLTIKNYPATVAIERQHREEYFKYFLTVGEAFESMPTVGHFIEIYDNLVFDWVEKSHGGVASRTIPGHTDAHIARDSELDSVLDFYKATKYQGVEAGVTKFSDIFREGWVERMTEIPRSQHGATPFYIKMSDKVRDLLKSGKADQEVQAISSKFSRSVSEFEGKKSAAESAQNRLARDGYTDVVVETGNVGKDAKFIENASADVFKSQASKRVTAGGAVAKK